MENFPKPKDHREINKYSQTDLVTVEANKKELERRYEQLMDTSVNLENDIEMNANTKEIADIQNEILEIDNEIKRRIQNN